MLPQITSFSSLNYYNSKDIHLRITSQDNKAGYLCSDKGSIFPSPFPLSLPFFLSSLSPSLSSSTSLFPSFFPLLPPSPLPHPPFLSFSISYFLPIMNIYFPVKFHWRKLMFFFCKQAPIEDSFLVSNGRLIPLPLLVLEPH